VTPEQRLKAWRESQGITQAEAAKRAKVTQSAWSEWEGGQKIPQIHNAEDLELLTENKVTVAHWAERARAEADARAAERARKRDAGEPPKPTGTES
jgi:transcriptional regulator with XRE-family HTH domain